MGFGLYFQKLILPIAQSGIYSFPEPGSFVYYRLLVTGIIVLAAFATGIYYTYKKIPEIAGGLLFYFIFLSIVLHIIAFNSALIYERFTYLACIGLFIAILNLDKLFPSWKEHKLKIFALVTILFCFLTYNKAAVWKDSETLWSDIIDKNPKASEAFNNRGMVYFDRGEYDKAEIDFNEAIKLRPTQPDAYNNLSIIYFNRKDFTHALENNLKVLRLDPEHHDGISNRGCFYYTMNENDSAIYYYSKAEEIMPNNASAFFFCASAYYKKGEYRKSLEQYQQAVKINPNYADAYAYMGLCYVNLNIHDSALIAINNAERASSISGARQLVSTEYVIRGNKLFNEGDAENALRSYQTSLDIFPNAEAYYDIGGVWLTRKDVNRARDYWKKALTIDPNHKAAGEWLAKVGN